MALPILGRVVGERKVSDRDPLGDRAVPMGGYPNMSALGERKDTLKFTLSESAGRASNVYKLALFDVD